MTRGYLYMYMYRHVQEKRKGYRRGTGVGRWNGDRREGTRLMRDG